MRLQAVGSAVMGGKLYRLLVDKENTVTCKPLCF